MQSTAKSSIWRQVVIPPAIFFALTSFCALPRPRTTHVGVSGGAASGRLGLQAKKRSPPRACGLCLTGGFYAPGLQGRRLSWQGILGDLGCAEIVRFDARVFEWAHRAE